MNSATASAAQRVNGQGSVPRTDLSTRADFPFASEVPLPIGDIEQKAPAQCSARRGYLNLAGLDFLSIRLVVLCVELGCLSAAADACNLSLSAASHRLTNLEQKFRTRFFQRDHLGLHPTQAGTVFCSHARSILLTMQSAERQLNALLSRSL
jgi:hypothetical protein